MTIHPRKYASPPGNIPVRLSPDDFEEFQALFMIKEMLESEVKLRDLRYDVGCLNEKLGKKYVNNDKEDNMIEVGKVVMQPAHNSTVDNVFSTREESVSVSMGRQTIEMTCSKNGAHVAALSPDMAVKLAQLLMKAAECQTEYAAAAKELEEQRKRLEAKYKDMISGLGLENPDLQKKDLTKLPVQAWSGVNGGCEQG